MSDQQGKPHKSSEKDGAGRWAAILWCLAALPVTLILWPSLLVALPLMSPTLIALLADWRRSKYLTMSVGFLNAIGTLPALLSLWSYSHDLSGVLLLWRDPLSWGLALAAAGGGYLIFLVSEWGVAVYYRLSAGERVRKLIVKQEELLAHWGEEVVTPAAHQLMLESEAFAQEGARLQEEREGA